MDFQPEMRGLLVSLQMSDEPQKTSPTGMIPAGDALIMMSTLSGIRTLDPLIKSQLLYQLS